ncbi:MAG: ferredoxin III, nif-specific [Desulfuromonadales bacterium]
MTLMTGKTFGGPDWTPTFVMSIDADKCIGCGRCFKSCARKVLGPEDLVDEDTDSTRMIMTLANQADCIGCAGCGVACPKKCFAFKTKEI